MSRRPLLGACGVAALCAVASLILLRGGPFPSTFASFNAETHNASSTYAANWLGAPTGLSASVSAATATLGWTVASYPSPSVGQGQEILGSWSASSGTSTTCPTTGYTQLAVPSASATSYTDSGRGSGFGGNYYCYEVASTLGTNWFSPTAPARVQFPFYATSVTLANSNRTIASGDTIKIVFNNGASGLPSAPAVIACTSGEKVLIGASSCTGTPSVGTLVLSGKTIGTNNVSWTSSASGTNTYTVTLSGTSTDTLSSSGTASWAFTPSSGIKNANGVSICTSSGSGCVATVTGSF